MIKPEQVPLSILPAYSKALGENGDPRHAIAAALSAWPGMFATDSWDQVESLILPLPTEASDDQ